MVPYERQPAAIRGYGVQHIPSAMALMGILAESEKRNRLVDSCSSFRMRRRSSPRRPEQSLQSDMLLR